MDCFAVTDALAVRAYFLVSGCTGGWVQYISLLRSEDTMKNTSQSPLEHQLPLTGAQRTWRRSLEASGYYPGRRHLNIFPAPRGEQAPEPDGAGPQSTLSKQQLKRVGGKHRLRPRRQDPCQERQVEKICVEISSELSPPCSNGL